MAVELGIMRRFMGAHNATVVNGCRESVLEGKVTSGGCAAGVVAPVEGPGVEVCIPVAV